MKSLSDYIKENLKIENIESINEGSIKFNFDGMDNADDILKQFGSIQTASVNDKEVEVMCDANVDELKKVYDILKKYSDSQRSSQHRSSDEQYAQKTVKFEEKVNELKEMIDKVEAPEEKTADVCPKCGKEKCECDKKDNKKDDKKEEE